MQLKAKKVAASHYEYFDAESGRLIATIIRTGEYGRDNYPWDWYLEGKLGFNLSPEGKHVFTMGHDESKKACLDILRSRIDQYGLSGM